MSNEGATINRLKGLLSIKVCGELKRFEDKLRLSDIEEVLASAYELSVKRDFVYMLEEEVFDVEGYAALLVLNNTLDYLYKAWLEYSECIPEMMKTCTENSLKDLEETLVS